MGIRRMRLVAAAVGLAFAVAIALTASGAAGVAKAYGATTVLSVLSGRVLVSHAGGASDVARDGEVVREGDTIRTLDGRAVLTYFEGSTVVLDPNSELTVDETSTSADGGTIVLMTQTLGRTWHVVTKLITGASRYDVRTPASTASVRGTKFAVDADGDATTVTTAEGTVMQLIDDPAAPGTVVAVPVTAGMTQTQHRSAPPARSAPRTTPGRAANPRVVERPVGVDPSRDVPAGGARDVPAARRDPSDDSVPSRRVAPAPRAPAPRLVSAGRTPASRHVARWPRADRPPLGRHPAVPPPGRAAPGGAVGGGVVPGDVAAGGAPSGGATAPDRSVARETLQPHATAPPVRLRAR